MGARQQRKIKPDTFWSLLSPFVMLLAAISAVGHENWLAILLAWMSGAATMEIVKDK